MNNDAINIGVKISVRVLVFNSLRYVPRLEFLGHVVILYITF